LPDGWVLVKFFSIAEAIDPQPSHRTPPISPDNVPYIGISECNYQTKQVNFEKARKVGFNVLEEHKNRYSLKNGDFIIGKIGTIGKPFLIPIDCDYTLSANIILIQPKDEEIDKTFLFFLFCSDFITKQFNVGSKATTQAAFGIQKVRNIDVLLPPLAEQHRIVAAIESAFAVIDEIERNKTDLQSAVTAAKSKILSLAIRGKLVPQDANDEPASVLLERIRTEREALIKEGKIKRGKSDDTTIRSCDNSYYENVPFAIPDSWLWVRFGEICDYGSCNNVSADNIADDAWILDLEDIEKDTAKVIQVVYKKDRPFTSTKHSFTKGQVLYSKLRPYLNKVIVAPNDGFCTSEILPLPFKIEICSEYVRMFLMSDFFLAYANQCSYGVKMPRLGTHDGKKAWFALPPLTEQKRIALVVEETHHQLNIVASNLS